MEQFKLEKHWNDFINNKLVINCPTQKLANEFHDYCKAQNITWSSHSIENNYWSDENTCYRHQKSLTFSDIKHYENENYTVVEFQGIENKTPKYVIGDVVNIKIINYNTNEDLLNINRPTREMNIKNMSVTLSKDELEILADSMYQEYIKSKIPTTTTKETIEVIYHGKETIVLIKSDGRYYKGVASCHYQDTYDKEHGFIVAYQRARENQLCTTQNTRKFIVQQSSHNSPYAKGGIVNYSRLANM